MPAPVLLPVAQRVYDELRPVAYADADNGYFLAHMVQAWCKAMEVLETFVRDTDDGPGYSIIMDPDIAPEMFLDFLSQMVGSRPVIGETVAQKRERIKGMTGLRRGSPQAIYAAAARKLTGDKTVIFNERAGGNAWALEIYTLAEETPEPKTATAWGDPKNLIKDSGFELNNFATNWQEEYGSSTVASETGAGNFRSGTRSVKITRTTSTGEISLGVITGNRPDVTAGEEYSFSGYFKCFGSAQPFRARLNWYDSGGAVIGAAVDSADVAGSTTEFRRVTLTAIAPANAVKARVQVRGENSAFAVGEGAYFDDIMFNEGLLLDYFDGSFTHHRFAGTAHDSASESPTEFDAPEILAEIMSQKPAGIKLTYKAIQGITWQTIIAQYLTWDATIDANSTWGNVLADDI